MRKFVELDGHSVELNSSAGWLYIYRSNFGRDILPDIMPMLQGLLTLMVDFMGETNGTEVTVGNLIEYADEEKIDNLAATFSGLETITILNIFWSMAKNADPSIPEPQTFFSELDCLALDEMLPQMLELIIQSSVSSKNSMSLLNQFKSLKLNRNQSVSTSSQSQELTEG